MRQPYGYIKTFFSFYFFFFFFLLFLEGMWQRRRMMASIPSVAATVCRPGRYTISACLPSLLLLLLSCSISFQSGGKDTCSRVMCAPTSAAASPPQFIARTIRKDKRTIVKKEGKKGSSPLLLLLPASLLETLKMIMNWKMERGKRRNLDNVKCVASSGQEQTQREREKSVLFIK